MKTEKQIQRGQGMTEYVILVALIAIVAITGFTALGGSVNEKVNAHSSTIGNLPDGSGG